MKIRGVCQKAGEWHYCDPCFVQLEVLRDATQPRAFKRCPLLADSVEKVRRRDRTSCRAAADAISELGCGGPVVRPGRDVGRPK